MDEVGFEDHNHAACQSGMIAPAEAYCAHNKSQFIAPRRRVLEIFLEEPSALGTHGIIARFGEEGFGSQPAMAYRARDFLVGHGFVLKLKRLNALIPCTCPYEAHTSTFMIYREC